LVGGLACDSLWHRNRVLAEAALEHPFVQGIASGELASATFAYYVGQDAAFLDAFCRAYALALAKSPDQDGLIAFRELLDAAAEELRLHRGYADRWNIDLHQAADPATAAYTNFLLAVAALERVGHIAAAMIPCLRLYAYLGQQLAAQTTPDSPYREWVMYRDAAPDMSATAGNAPIPGRSPQAYAQGEGSAAASEHVDVRAVVLEKCLESDPELPVTGGGERVSRSGRLSVMTQTPSPVSRKVTLAIRMPSSGVRSSVGRLGRGQQSADVFALKDFHREADIEVVRPAGDL